ncbi:MAG: adenosylcobinamide-GDP ribazoletransferase [Lachnospiraceae bacterium]|nr:adenosylcobinamide-GDP ribazoletransferase [Lachnospiraceae bacterium]
MKKVWNSFLIAFSMFSKIPVPRADWDKENMKYMMCFFPAIGIVIGAMICGYAKLCEFFAFGDLMCAAGYVLIPVLVTGGIHLDGFLDTVDALNSYQPTERKLEILKDSHAGAFAIIMGCVYFVLALGVWSEMSIDLLPVMGVGYVVSRSLSGLALTSFPCANRKGSLGMFADAAQRNVVKTVLVLWLAVGEVVACLQDWRFALVLFGTAAAVYGYYYRLAMKEFGGTTGDIAGFFVQICELAMACAVMLGGKIL